MSIALATHTACSAWINEPDEVLATVLDIFAEQAEERRKGGKR